MKSMSLRIASPQLSNTTKNFETFHAPLRLRARAIRRGGLDLFASTKFVDNIRISQPAGINRRFVESESNACFFYKMNRIGCCRPLIARVGCDLYNGVTGTRNEFVIVRSVSDEAPNRASSRLECAPVTAQESRRKRRAHPISRKELRVLEKDCEAGCVKRSGAAGFR